MLVLLLLLKVRRDVERLDSAVVLRLHLLLESPLSLVSLMDSAVTCHASGTNRIVQETFRAHISVLEFVLNVCQLVFRRIWKARHDPTGLHVQLLANMQSILQDRSTVGLLRVIVVHATTGLVRGLNCSLTGLLLIIRVVSSFSQILELSLIVSGPTKLLVHPDARVIDGPVGLVGGHFLLCSGVLLVPVVPGLAHAVEVLCLLSRNRIALRNHNLTLTLAHSRVLLGVVLTVCTALNESG